MTEKIAFLFPGQGAQYPGMGQDLFENFSESRNVFEVAEKILNLPLKKYCFEGPVEILKSTSICQVAVFTVSMAIFYAFKTKLDIKPSYVLGLSLGEYSALVAAGALEFEEGLRLVKRRAELMEEETKRSQGKMCAVIGLDREEIKRVCLDCDNLYIANFNCPEQIVISGEKGSIDKAKQLCLQKGASKVVELEVAGAFHSPYMQRAAERFKEFIKEIRMFPLETPVVSNVDAVARRDPQEIKEVLVKQICSPVLWEDSIRWVVSQGVSKFYEIGPGKVLRGLVRKIAPEVMVINIEKTQDIINLCN